MRLDRLDQRSAFNLGVATACARVTADLADHMAEQLARAQRRMDLTLAMATYEMNATMNELWQENRRLRRELAKLTGVSETLN